MTGNGTAHQDIVFLREYLATSGSSPSTGHRPSGPPCGHPHNAAGVRGVTREREHADDHAWRETAHLPHGIPWRLTTPLENFTLRCADYFDFITLVKMSQ